MTYRSVQSTFWQDSFVLDLTPEEKYFYIYLMTNSKANQIGIYELPKRIIETETGYNRETVDKLLQRFVEYGKIEYHEPTKELFMKNWVKHNWNNSPKVIKHIENELKNVKHEPFVLEYALGAESIKPDTVSIQYPNGIDIVSMPYCKEKEKVKEKLKEKVKEEREVRQGRRLPDSELILSKDKGQKLGEFINNFEFEVLGLNTKGQQRKLSVSQITSFNDLAADVLYYDFELMEKAKAITIRNQKKSYPYFESILLNWYDEGIQSIEDYNKVNGRQEKRVVTAQDYENA